MTHGGIVDQDIRWYHSIDLGDGEVTPGVAPLSLLRDRADDVLPDVYRKSVLDIAAWDGFWSFEVERRGAADVLATDHFCWSGEGPGTKAGFDYAHHRLGSKVRSHDVDVFGLDPNELGMFDVVLFLGVLYHLADPLGGLRRAAAMCRDCMVVETLGTLQHVSEPALRLYAPGEINGDRTNVFAHNKAGLDLMLRMCGFTRIDLHYASDDPLTRLVGRAYR